MCTKFNGDIGTWGSFFSQVLCGLCGTNWRAPWIHSWCRDESRFASVRWEARSFVGWGSTKRACGMHWGVSLSKVLCDVGSKNWWWEVNLSICEAWEAWQKCLNVKLEKVLNFLGRETTIAKLQRHSKALKFQFLGKKKWDVFFSQNHSNSCNNLTAPTARGFRFPGLSRKRPRSQDFGAYSSQVTRAEKTPQEWSDMIDLMTKSWASEEKTTKKNKGNKKTLLSQVDMECQNFHIVERCMEFVDVCWFVKVIWSWWVAIKKDCHKRSKRTKDVKDAWTESTKKKRHFATLKFNEDLSSCSIVGLASFALTMKCQEIPNAKKITHRSAIALTPVNKNGQVRL